MFKSRFAKVELNDDGDYAVFEYSFLTAQFVFQRTFVFEQNADEAAKRIDLYHRDRELFLEREGKR